jgi:heme A synthase
MTELSRRRFTRFGWFVLAFNVAVVLWGAFVRVSFSGDGCGANWPLCNGQAIPRAMSLKTAIEFTHRMMTSGDVFLVAVLLVAAFRVFPRRHVVRRQAVWSAVFLFAEALLGAGLVRFRLVAHDQSAGRALYLSAHLINTLLLLGAILSCIWAADRNQSTVGLLQISRRRLTALVVVMVVSITGALAALGDTLFPASSLAAGLSQDFATASSWFLRLRVLHPAIAVLGAVYLLWVAIQSLKENDRIAAERVLGVTVVQVLAGIANVGLLAPEWMQLLHLLIADVLWMVTLWWGLESLRAHISLASVEPNLVSAVPGHL